jgi:APA family basic amino acid/polyamine antiporter
MLSALSYAEFAAMSPTSGSAYGYARATLGPRWGWIIGFDLILEYSVAAASVAQGFSRYFNAFLKLMGGSVPTIFRSAPFAYDADSGDFTGTGSAFDLPAIAITVILSVILYRGIKESARLNTIMVITKVAIVIFVIIAGSLYVKAENYHPFLPFGFFGISFFGYSAIGQTDPSGAAVGVLAGSAIVFFAYIGFDAVSCNAEETKNPQRDLPIGILGSLAISTVLYVLVSIVLVGMIPYNLIDREAPISDAFHRVGLGWCEWIIALGALAGLTSVLMVTLLGQPRIFMAMARDSLLPAFFAESHRKFQTPYKSTVVTGIFVSLFAGFIPLSILVELVSIGTLFAFAIVNISVILLRKKHPEIPRPFKCPGVPYIPALGAALCFLLMISLPSANWIRLIIWFALGQAIYYFYGKKNQEKPRNIEDLRREAAFQEALHGSNSGGNYHESSLSGENDQYSHENKNNNISSDEYSRKDHSVQSNEDGIELAEVDSTAQQGKKVDSQQHANYNEFRDEAAPDHAE